MSFSITDAMVQQFGSNVRHLAQQSEARLRGKVIEEMIHGDSAYLEQLAPSYARKVTTRHADTPLMNVQHLRRRIAPYPYDYGELVDRLDKETILIDPESAYVKAGGDAMRRGQDDEVIQAFFGTAYTGHSGSTVVTWPNGNNESQPPAPGGTVVAVNDWTYGTGSGNAGLTVSKLISASAALDIAEGDEEEERYILVGGRQKADLLKTTEATSSDYNTVRTLYDGKLDTYMGFKFIHSERLQKDATGYWRVPAWRKSGVGLGIGQDIQVKVAERPDKRFATQVYVDEFLGGSRLEEAKVVEIKCQ